jgi:hypothetical protein
MGTLKSEETVQHGERSINLCNVARRTSSSCRWRALRLWMIRNAVCVTGAIRLRSRCPVRGRRRTRLGGVYEGIYAPRIAGPARWRVLGSVSGLPSVRIGDKTSGNCSRLDGRGQSEPLPCSSRQSRRPDEHRDIFGPEAETVIYFRDAKEAAQRACALLCDSSERKRLSVCLQRGIAGGAHTYTHRPRTMLRIASGR